MNEPAVAAASTVVVHEVADLARIYDPHVNVVVLARDLVPALAAQASTFACAATPDARFFVPTGNSGRSVVHAALSDTELLAEDVATWIEVVGELTGAKEVGVRLARVREAMCPRLHVDRVTLRAVVAYTSVGTEYYDSRFIDRRVLGHKSGGKADAESGVLLPGATLQRAGTGHVVLLKGELWPDNAGRGAVHRSPAVAAGDTRLMLTLDPL
jgi:hypothetical protein